MSYELRPLTLAEILDAAFRLVQTEWKVLVGLPMLLQVPMLMIGSQASWLFDPFSDPFSSGEEPSAEALMEMGLVAVGIGFAYLLLYPLIAGAVTAAVGNYYLGRSYSLAEAMRAAFGAFIKIVLAILLYGFGLVVGLIVVGAGVGLVGGVVGAGLAALDTAGSVLIGIGVFVLGCFFGLAMLFGMAVNSLLSPVIMLESKGVFSSVKRAFALGWTAKLRLVGVVFTAGIIVGIPVVGAQMMIGFVPYAGWLIWALFQAVGFAFSTSVAVVLYFDLRCRAENYDLELLAQQVEAGPGLGRG